MADDLISVIDLATQHGIHKQTIFKVLSRLGIATTKRRGADNRGQIVAYIKDDEARTVVEALRSGASSSGSRDEDSASIPDVLLAEQGVFYLLQLEPQHDPGRFKVGYAASLPERLRQLRCSAPLAVVVASWPCKRLWRRRRSSALLMAASGSTPRYFARHRSHQFAKDASNSSL